MAFPETKTAKTVATITLISFFWVYLGLGEIAIAGNDTAESGVHSSKEKAKNGEWHTAKRRGEVSSPTFEDVLERMRKAEERTHEKIEKGEDISEEEREIEKQEAGIDQRDAGIRQRFKETEEKIKDLPEEIKQRHRDFVEKYEENYRTLKTKLNDIKKAKTGAEKHEAHRKAKDFLEKVRPPTRHTPLDPNKLPHRAEEHKELKKPRLKKEQFERDLSPQRAQREEEIQETELRRQGKGSAQHIAFSGQQSAFGGATLSASPTLKKGETGGLYNDPILVAANGSLDGLLNAQNSELSTENYPLLALAAPPTQDDLAETIEVQFTPEVLQLAADLGNSPVKIYNHIRNHFEYEPYSGSLKGAAQTLLEKAGNDFDQASLLITLLRVSNIPARYVYGTIEMPIEKFMNWVGGVTDINTAVQILATAGVPGQTLSEGGQIKYVQFEHVWVEAYVSYGPHRGAKEEGNKTWIPMDPSYKQYYQRNRGMDLHTALSINGEQFLFDYISDISTVAVPAELQSLFSDYIISPYQFFGQKLMSYLEANMPDYDLEAVIGDAEGYLPNNFIIQKNHPFLLGSLPYKVVMKGSTLSSVPDNLRHQLTIALKTPDTLYSLGSEDFIYSLPMSQWINRRITLSYEPATQSDSDLISQYGTIYNVPAYLVEMRAVLKIDGNTVAAGNPVGLGYDQTLSMTFNTPNKKKDVVTNTIIAGNYAALVLVPANVRAQYSGARMEDFRTNLRKVPLGSETVDSVLGELLYNIGLSYFGQLFFQESLYAQAFQVLVYREPSEAMVSKELTVDCMFAVPASVKMGGIAIDVDRNQYMTLSLDTNKQRTKDFMAVSGVTSSVLENRILELLIDIPSISAIKVLKLASKQGIPIYTIDSSNVDQINTLLQTSSTVKTNIRNAVNAGKKVIVPKSDIQYLDWSGTGYVVLDPVTGAGAYMISTGQAGGASCIDFADEGFDSVNEVYARLCPIEREKVIRWTLEFYGVPYVPGGKVPYTTKCNKAYGLDCSGLVGYVYKMAGYPELFWNPVAPNDPCYGISAQQQYELTKSTDYPLIADLVFFYGTRIIDGIPVTKIHHVGILIAKDIMIHAWGAREEKYRFVTMSYLFEIGANRYSLLFGTVMDETCNIYDQ